MGLGDPQAIWATGGIVGPGGKGLFDSCIEVGATLIVREFMALSILGGLPGAATLYW